MDMRTISAGMIVFLAAGAVLAQTPDARPAFEAAFIKPNTTGSNGSRTNGSTGQIVMVNQTLKRLIERAYNVKQFQVTGPEWIENVRFDVTAKYPPDTKREDRPAMLRTMLEDRFKLATHRDSKEMSGYALVVAKSGLKLKAVETDKGGGTDSNSNNSLVTLKMTGVSMKQLADYLADRLGSAVIDGTGADGKYTFELRWTLDDQLTGAVDRGAVEFAAIQDAISTLGLHLQAQKVPVEIVVVDHVERVPTEN
jgi:uncharacterized protein (TIGR03435 family)